VPFYSKNVVIGFRRRRVGVTKGSSSEGYDGLSLENVSIWEAIVPFHSEDVVVDFHKRRMGSSGIRRIVRTRV
jgi:hypothetical protein